MILFLDFDGVLHPFHRPTGAFSLLPYFERVMRDLPQMDIVISSSWREAHSLEEMKSFFSPDVAERIIDATPVLNFLEHQYVREDEIAAWLHRADREREPWVAIDDMESFFSPQCDCLILIDPDTGFNEEAEKELRKRWSAASS